MHNRFPIPFYNGALTNTAVLVATGKITILGFRAENAHTAVNYVQFFNKATAADVTLGTTVPDFAVLIPASGAADFNLDFKGDTCPLRLFDKGVVVAITSGRTTNGAPTAAGGLHLFYEVL